MSHVEITDLSGITGVVVDHGHAEILSVTGFMAGALHGHAEFTAVSGVIGTTGGSHAEFTTVSGIVAIPTTLQARGGTDVQTPPIVDVTFDGSGSTGAWVSATWAVVSDSRTRPAPPFPTVLTPISPNGADTDSIITLQFPPHPDTYTVVLQLTVTDGVTIATDTVTVTVWAWPFWRPSGSVLVPRIKYRRVAA